MNPYFPTDGGALYVDADGQSDPERRWDPLHPTAILPGAFDPVHPGHWGLADAAAQWLGASVAFELSVANVDKPPLAAAEVQRRLAQFAGKAAVWLTHAPRFVEKAELFPRAVFVVGADTALRIVDPRYSAGDTDRMHAALSRVRDCGGRFLVACRKMPSGVCIALADAPVPAAFRDLFADIPADRFRLDISSTEVRKLVTRPENPG